jgi:hypothetical protein
MYRMVTERFGNLGSEKVHYMMTLIREGISGTLIREGISAFGIIAQRPLWRSHEDTSYVEST